MSKKSDMKAFNKSLYFTLFVALINVPFIAYVVSDDYTTFDLARFIMIELLYSSIIFTVNYLLFKFTKVCSKSKLSKFFIALFTGLFIWSLDFALLHVIDTGDFFISSLFTSLVAFMPIAMLGYFGWVFMLLYIIGFILVCDIKKEKKDRRLFKKILKIIFFTLLFGLLAFAFSVYMLFTADNSEYSSTSPSGKYQFTIHESCFFGCEQSAEIRRIKDDVTQFCFIGGHGGDFPKLKEGVTFKWSKDEKKVTWNSHVVDLSKDSQNHKDFCSPSFKNFISITQKCLFKENCHYTFSYVTERYDRSTTSDANICPIIDNKKAGELFSLDENSLHWSSDERSITYRYKGKNETLDLYKECIEKGYQPKIFDYLSETSFRIFKKYTSGIPEAAFEDEGFYPLGISKDGKFAYMIDHLTGTADIFDIETIVIDLHTNYIIYKDKFKTLENNPKHVTVESYWEQNRDKIIKKLDSFNISLVPSEYFTLTDNIQNYRWEYDTNKTINDNYVKSYKVHLSKGIIDERNHDMIPSHVLEVGVVGHFAVGYDYLAVVIGEVIEGHEGVPHEISYHVVGAPLWKF